VCLSGGPGPHEGRLEVHYQDTWGTMCHDSFDDTIARVVCDMLGYVHVGWFTGNHYFGHYGRIWLDDVQCNYETRS